MKKSIVLLLVVCLAGIHPASAWAWPKLPSFSGKAAKSDVKTKDKPNEICVMATETATGMVCMLTMPLLMTGPLGGWVTVGTCAVAGFGGNWAARKACP